MNEEEPQAECNCRKKNPPPIKLHPEYSNLKEVIEVVNHLVEKIG